MNLLTNAAKYGGNGAWVGVHAAVSPDHRGEILISVEDRGLGIAREDLPHIFEPFYRGANAIERQIRGSGIGLSIVQSIVRAHGGRVTVATRTGAGSTFTMYLPVAETSPEPTLASAPSPRSVPGSVPGV